MSPVHRMDNNSSLRRFIERCRSIDLRQPLTTICLFLFLSFFTSIIVQMLKPTLLIKTFSPSVLSSSSSSLSLFSSSHIFFPSDSTSLQCSSMPKRESRAHNSPGKFANTKRKYTKNRSRQKNVSNGKFSFISNKSRLVHQTCLVLI